MYERRKHSGGGSKSLRMRRKSGFKRHFVRNVRNVLTTEAASVRTGGTTLSERGVLPEKVGGIDMDGFVPLDRRIMKSALWDKPAYYVKIYIFLLMNAAYRDGMGLERGQVITTKKELCEICESGRGGSKQTISLATLKNVLQFFSSDFPESPMSISSYAGGRLLITLLKYNEITCSAPSENRLRNVSESAEKKASINNNNNNNFNNANNNKTSGFAPRIKKSKFNNFSGRINDYEALKKVHREQARRLAERIEKNEKI